MMKKAPPSQEKKGSDDVGLAKFTDKMKKSTSVMRDELVLLNSFFIIFLHLLLSHISNIGNRKK